MSGRAGAPAAGGRAAGGGGGRGRGGRGRGGRRGQTKKKPSHRSSIKELSDHIFDCSEVEDAGRFVKSKEALLNYIRMTGEHEASYVADSLRDLVLAGPPRPPRPPQNDVGASAACGAKPIWFAVEGDREELPSWSTATREELLRRAALDEVAREFVSAQIGSLEELPGTIVEVLRS